jgi:hypothetical protein
LDASKIDALTKETHEVISILSKLMTESDPIESDSLKTDTASTAVLEPAEWLSYLDERYHPAFLKLITKGEISLRDFDTFALLIILFLKIFLTRSTHGRTKLWEISFSNGATISVSAGSSGQSARS